MTGIFVAALVIAVPAFVFACWPFLRGRSRGRTFLALPPDARQQLLEQKHAVLRALNELDFEHEAGHVSDEDYAELRARYESEAATVLTELDKLETTRKPSPASRAREVQRDVERDDEASVASGAWRHPGAIAVTAVALVVFGAALGLGISRYSTPDAPADTTAPGGMNAGPTPGGMMAGTPAAGPTGGGAPGSDRPITPEMQSAMLKAAHDSLTAGDYQNAISAYQAILRRDPKNVDAITHLGLIVAIGGHADAGLEAFDRALALDPNYAPALMYRGQVLYEAKSNAPEAIRAWEKYLKVAPAGEDRDRVQKMIAQAKAGPARPSPSSSVR